MAQIKSSWVPVEIPKIKEMFWNLVQLAHQKNLFSKETKDYVCLGLYASNRRTRNIGTCHTDYRWEEWCIVINDKLLQCPEDKIRQILVHEIAHACVPFDHHGYNWRYTANRLGEQWGYEAERLCSDTEIISITNPVKKERKYIVECPLCHVQWKYKVKCNCVKYPQTYTHRRCGTHLVRIDKES